MPVETNSSNHELIALASQKLVEQLTPLATQYPSLRTHSLAKQKLEDGTEVMAATVPENYTPVLNVLRDIFISVAEAQKANSTELELLYNVYDPKNFIKGDEKLIKLFSEHKAEYGKTGMDPLLKLNSLFTGVINESMVRINNAFPPIAKPTVDDASNPAKKHVFTDLVASGIITSFQQAVQSKLYFVNLKK